MNDETLNEYMQNAHDESAYTKETWEKAILSNAYDSYGLAVMVAAVLIAENPDKNMHELIKNNLCGLSGAQFSFAVSTASFLYRSKLLCKD